MSDVEQEPCPECGGATIAFRGQGQGTEYRVCTRYREPGHLSEAELQKRFQAEVQRRHPSGRYA